MARAATTSDAFNAVAEPRRREILLLLAGREYSVNEIVDGLRVDQPSVSKHLRVLRDTGLVRMRCKGARSSTGQMRRAFARCTSGHRSLRRYWSTS